MVACPCWCFGILVGRRRRRSAASVRVASSGSSSPGLSRTASPRGSRRLCWSSGCCSVLLLITGTTIREVPVAVQALFLPAGTDVMKTRRRIRRLRREPSPTEPKTTPTGYYDDPRAPGDESQAWPGAVPQGRGLAGNGTGTPYDNYPLDEEAPTVPEPAGPRQRRRKNPGQEAPETGQAGSGGGRTVHAPVIGSARRW